MPKSLGDTKDLLEHEWLKWREHGPKYADPLDREYIPTTVGGSFVSTIFGVSPWLTRLEGYNIKCGIRPAIEEEENKESKRAGHIYEPFVADAFLEYMNTIEKKEVELWNDTNMYQHNDYPWAIVNLDRRIKIDGIEGILECKTTSSRNFSVIEKWKKGIVPIYYELQCRFYMEVMDLDYCYICCCWGFLPDDKVVIRIDRDKVFGQEIMDTCERFVYHVTSRTPIDISDENTDNLLRYYVKLYGVLPEEDDPVDLSDNAELIKEYIQLENEISDKEKEIKELETQKRSICAEIYPLMLDNTSGIADIDGNAYGIDLKIPMHRAEFDEDAFMSIEPNASEYTKSYVDTDLLKKQNPVLYEAYMLPATPNLDKNKYPTLKIKQLKSFVKSKSKK